MNVVGCHGFLSARVGILAHSDDVLHLEEAHHIQEGLVAQRVQLSQNLHRHVGGRHVLARLCHEGQRAEVVDGAGAEEALCCRAQPSEQLPEAGARHLGIDKTDTHYLQSGAQDYSVVSEQCGLQCRTVHYIPNFITANSFLR